MSGWLRRQHGREHDPRGGSDPVPGIPRESYGQIDSGDGDTGYGAGILDPGSGDWGVSTDFGGIWTITFAVPFATPPTVVLTENSTTTVPPSFLQETSVTTAGFTVSTFDKTGTLASDIGFNFIATAPA